MEGLQKAVRGVISKDNEPYASATTTASEPLSSSLLLTRPPRRAVSILTCSKLCAFCFVAGIIVGYTLKRRVGRWAAKLLRRIKDD